MFVLKIVLFLVFLGVAKSDFCQCQCFKINQDPEPIIWPIYSPRMNGTDCRKCSETLCRQYCLKRINNTSVDFVARPLCTSWTPSIENWIGKYKVNGCESRCCCPQSILITAFNNGKQTGLTIEADLEGNSTLCGETGLQISLVGETMGTKLETTVVFNLYQKTLSLGVSFFWVNDKRIEAITTLMNHTTQGSLRKYYPVGPTCVVTNGNLPISPEKKRIIAVSVAASVVGVFLVIVAVVYLISSFKKRSEYIKVINH